MADNPRIEELRRRVQSDPASIAFAALAEEFRREGRFDEAVAACRTGLKRHPSYLSAHVTLGRALLEIAQYDEAREEFALVLRAAPENLAAIRGLAEIHHRMGEPVPAPAEAPRSATTPPAAPRVPMPASAVAGLGPDAPEPDPALAALESFLAAVQQARESRADAPR